MDQNARVDESDARVQAPIRRPTPRLTIDNAYTDFLTLSEIEEEGQNDAAG
jgi:hypothetical protein